MSRRGRADTGHARLHEPLGNLSSISHVSDGATLKEKQNTAIEMHRLKSIFARTRRGVSLLELLIGLGILLAISAIVIPWTTGWLGTRELDNAEDGLTMQMMMARAAAREGGRAVEVVAEFNGSQSSINARFMSSAEGNHGNHSGHRTDADGASPINASWARMQLPRGVRIALGMENAERGSDELLGSPLDKPMAATTDELSTEAGQTLAIFLPDGTVFFAPMFMLRTDAGSLRALQVDHATGVPQQVEKAADIDRTNADRPEFDGVSFDDAPIARPRR